MSYNVTKDHYCYCFAIKSLLSYYIIKSIVLAYAFIVFYRYVIFVIVGYDLVVDVTVLYHICYFLKFYFLFYRLLFGFSSVVLYPTIYYTKFSSLFWSYRLC